jgi:hypothetical protein
MDENELVRAVHEAALVGGTLIHEVPDLPEQDALASEWKTFKREVYRLMCMGDKGRFALIKCDRIVSVWDTHRDAVQAGRERSGRNRSSFRKFNSMSSRSDPDTFANARPTEFSDQHGWAGS